MAGRVTDTILVTGETVCGTVPSEASVSIKLCPRTTESEASYITGLVEGTKITGSEGRYSVGVVDGISVLNRLSETTVDTNIQSWVALGTNKSEMGSPVLMVSPSELASVVPESNEGRDVSTK